MPMKPEPITAMVPASAMPRISASASARLRRVNTLAASKRGSGMRVASAPVASSSAS